MSWLNSVFGKPKPRADEKVEALTVNGGALPAWATTPTGFHDALGHKSYATVELSAETPTEPQ